MATGKNVALIDEKTHFNDGVEIAHRILSIRGRQVLLDSELATLYAVETKAINQAVKRNLERFPERNCFQLSKDEFNVLRSQIVTSKTEKRGGRQYFPYAFTEQGVAMLSAVLRSETAIRVSLQIMDAFVQMRRLLAENQNLLETGPSIFQISLLTSQNTRDIVNLTEKLAKTNEKTDSMQTELQKIMDNFVDPSAFKHFLILNGQKLEADVAYTQIYAMARKTILVVDNYVGVKTLDLLRGVAKNVKVTILGDQRGSGALTPQIVADFKAARPDIELVLRAANNKFHDRYILLDSGLPGEKLFHCGASSKDAGGKITTIMEIENAGMYREVF